VIATTHLCIPQSNRCVKGAGLIGYPKIAWTAAAAWASIPRVTWA
jgi:hypothetical protein